MMYTNIVLRAGLVEHGLMINRTDILKLRDLEDGGYVKFMMKMGPGMVSHQKWKSSMFVATGKRHNFSSVVSVSDEAFCIFAIENSWVRWMTKEDLIEKEKEDYSWEFTTEEEKAKSDVLVRRNEKPADQIWSKRQLAPNKYSGEVRRKNDGVQWLDKRGNSKIQHLASFGSRGQGRAWGRI